MSERQTPRPGDEDRLAKRGSQCSLCGSQGASGLLEKRGYRLVRCGGCGLIRRDPLPTTEQVAALYAPASGYQLHRTRALENRYDAWTHRRDAYLASILGEPPQPGARLLDVGCATGTFLVEARARGWSVRGIEPGEHLVSFGRNAYKLDIDVGGAEDGADRYDTATFDVVTMWDVVEHLRDPLHAMKVMLRLVKPGGRLWVATPNEDGWVPRFHWTVVKPLSGTWPHPEPPRHLYQFSRKTLARLFRTAGFARPRILHDEIPLWYTSGFGGVPGVKEWLRGEQGASRTLYLASLPAFVAARAFRRGDSVIVSGVRT